MTATTPGLIDRVFISSGSGLVEQYRGVARVWLAQRGLATVEAPAQVEGCATLVLLLGHRYDIAAEREYWQAMTQPETEVLAFLVAEPETAQPTELDDTNRQKRFVSDVSAAHPVPVVGNTSAFRAELVEAASRSLSAVHDDGRSRRLHAVPPYASRSAFIGRAAELAALDDWGRSADPVLVIESMGGTGKSALAWQWTSAYAPNSIDGLAGRLWWSFYDRPRSMETFLREVLTYIWRDPARSRGLARADVLAQVEIELRRRPYLLALDGFERLLRGYDRAYPDATDTSRMPASWRSAADPWTDDAVRMLAASGPSKILVSTRMMPESLTVAGAPLPNTRLLRLAGLAEADAVRVLTNAGVQGEAQSLTRFVDRLDDNPLLIGLVAGLVREYPPAPGDFDRWLADPVAGGALNASDLDTIQRHSAVLAAACAALPDDSLRVVQWIAERLRPATTARLAAVPLASTGPAGTPERHSDRIVAALRDLMNRNMLFTDPGRSRVDMHPVLRAFLQSRRAASPQDDDAAPAAPAAPIVHAVAAGGRIRIHAPSAGAVELATLLSVAVRIEPALIRLARVRLRPRLDVSAEADLWFSAWVATRGPDSIVLRAEVTRELRQQLADRLAADPADPAHRVWAVVRAVHGRGSPALLLEEQVAWLAVQPAGGDLDGALRPALHAMLADPGNDVAEWFVRAWQRLPESARASRTVWQMAQVAGSRLRQVPAALADHPGDLDLVDASAVVDGLPDTRVGVTRTGDELVVAPTGGAVIDLPDTNPRLLDVTWVSGGEVVSQLLRVPEGDAARLTVQGTMVWIRTARGTVYEFPPLPGGPRVDIAYVYDTAAHYEQVQRLWRLLRASGFDAVLTVLRGPDDIEPPVAQRPQPVDWLIVLARHNAASADVTAAEFSSRWPDTGVRTVAVLLPGDTAEQLPWFADVYRPEHVVVDALTTDGLTGLLTVLRQVPAAAGPDLDLTIATARDLLQQTDPADLRSVKHLVVLFEALQQRFAVRGDPADLDEALQVGRRIAAETPGGARRTRALLGLTDLLRRRSQDRADPADLDEAIVIARGVLADTRDVAEHFGRLGLLLLERYGWLGQQRDLDESIAVTRRALDLTPTDHPARPRLLVELSAALLERFEGLGDQQALAEAISLCEAATALAAPPNASRPAVLASHATALLVRASMSGGTVADVNTAIAALGEAIAATPDGSPDRGNRQFAGSRALLLRYRLAGDVADLVAAIQLGREAMASIGPFRPDLGALLLHVGKALHEHFLVTGDVTDLDRAVGILSEAVRQTAGRPAVRLAAALAWGDMAAEAGRWRPALDGYSRAVALLPRAAWRGFDRHHRERVMAGAGSLAGKASAAALAAGAVASALPLVEQARSVLWSEDLDTRIDLNPLRRVDPALAERLLEIAVWLEGPGSMVSAEPAGTTTPRIAETLPPHLADTADRRMALAREWDDLVERVRQRPGFDDFLRPARLETLVQAAQGGPVIIINVSPWRCDALIVTVGGVSVVELPDLTQDTAAEQVNTYLASGGLTRDLAPFLRWMWDAFAERVLDHLEYTKSPASGTPWPRVWWCPTGPLALAPVHAAGDHTRAGASVLDRVVSSYTPTLRALLESQHTPTGTAIGGGRMLVVGMPQTPGHADLPGVAAEIRTLRSLLADGSHTFIIGAQATRDAVLHALPEHSWVHIGCSGDQDLDDPVRGRLYLQDGTITVADFAGLRLRGEFAFLSSAKSALGGVQVPDEAITLAAALQYAGFRHVIAALASVDDAGALQVTGDVYSRLIHDGRLDSRNAAQALHEAVRRLRQAHPGSPYSWAPFVHFGP